MQRTFLYDSYQPSCGRTVFAPERDVQPCRKQPIATKWRDAAVDTKYSHTRRHARCRQGPPGTSMAHFRVGRVNTQPAALARQSRTTSTTRWAAKPGGRTRSQPGEGGFLVARLGPHQRPLEVWTLPKTHHTGYTRWDKRQLTGRHARMAYHPRRKVTKSDEKDGPEHRGPTPSFSEMPTDRWRSALSRKHKKTSM